MDLMQMHKYDVQIFVRDEEEALSILNDFCESSRPRLKLA